MEYHELPRLAHADLPPELNVITGAIVDCAVALHRELGPGCLEGAYSILFVHALRRRGLAVRTEVHVPASFEGVTVATGLRIDILVNEQVVVEVKAVERVLPIHRAQLVTYLKLSGRPVGLLINFNEERVSHGIFRYVRTTTGERAETAERPAEIAETNDADVAERRANSL